MTAAPVTQYSLVSTKRLLPAICLAVASVVLSGCSAIPAKSNNKWSEFSNKVDAHGALPVMHHEFDLLPFVEMLEGVENSATCIQRKSNGEFEPISYQCATKKFYDRTRPLPEPSQRLERNRIQEHILAISEDRCNAYKRYLRYDQSMSNFWLGFGSTLAGGFGALSNSLSAAKTFSAFGGVLSGINAEYNQAFYGNLFYSVITKAIDEQRRDAYRQIQTYGQSRSLSDYPLEAAIKDAILYDGTCSAVSAMEYAEKAVQLVNDPGMDGMMRYLLKANQSRYILQNNVKDINELKMAGVTSTFENSRFGSQIVNEDKTSPLSIIQMELSIANQKTAKDIVEAASQPYEKGDKGKMENWKKMALPKVNDQLTRLIQDFKAQIEQCLDPAATLYNDYVRAETQFQRASKNEITEAQIKRDQAQKKVEQVSIEIYGISQHFQTLIDDLAKSTSESASTESSPTWNYAGLSENSKFAKKSPCEIFKQ